MNKPTKLEQKEKIIENLHQNSSIKDWIAHNLTSKKTWNLASKKTDIWEKGSIQSNIIIIIQHNHNKKKLVLVEIGKRKMEQ